MCLKMLKIFTHSILFQLFLNFNEIIDFDALQLKLIILKHPYKYTVKNR